MAEDQPSGFGLDGRSAVPDLNKFPGKDRLQKQGVFIPEMKVI